MKNIFKSFAVAFSMYSKIPMPRFEWASEDMKYHLCFFPLVGFVIGVFEFFWWKLSLRFDFSETLKYLFGIAIPVLVTGGFHLDGFMDTMDALHSYQPVEKKLEILKDPHIGAFSVICIITFFLLTIAFAFEIKTMEQVVAVSFSFFISRALSGISVIVFPKAKKDGMLSTEKETSAKKITLSVLFLELVAAICLLVFFTFAKSICGIAAVCAILISFAYYFFTSRKNFGGITGDLAGFFVCISEALSLAVISVCGIAGV